MRKPDFYNSEGYPNPTAYYAELHMLEQEKARRAELYKYRPLVYICSPFAGDVKTNVRMARLYSRFAVKRGCVPVTPHLLFPQFLNDNNKSERELSLVMGKILLTKCKEVWVFGDKISSGMSQEIKKAKWRGMPIRYFTADLQEVKK